MTRPIDPPESGPQPIDLGLCPVHLIPDQDRDCPACENDAEDDRHDAEALAAVRCSSCDAELENAGSGIMACGAGCAPWAWRSRCEHPEEPPK